MGEELNEEQQEQTEDTILTDSDRAVIDEINAGDQPVEESDEFDDVGDELPPDDEEDGGSETEVEGFNPDLMQAASAFGINTELYTSEDQLRGAIEATKQFAQMVQAPAQQQQYQQQQQQPPTEEQKQAAKTFGFDLGDDVDEDLKERFNSGLQSLADHFQEQQELIAQHVLQQQSYFQEIQQQQYEKQQEQNFNEWDNAVQGLDRDDRYGQGEFNSIQEGSKQHQDRVNLANQIGILSAGYQSQGQPVPSMEDLVRQADQMLFADDYKQQAKDEVTDRIKAQAKRTSKTGTKTRRPRTVPDDPAQNPTLIEWWENNVPND